MLSRIQNVFVGIFGEDILADITTEASMESVEKWDSLAFIKVLTGLEQEFGIRIDPDDAMSLVSVSGICELLQRKGF